MVVSANAALTNEQVDSLKTVADAGNVDAQYNLGLAFYFGNGVDVNNDLAHHYLELAALQGDPTAQYTLAELQDLGYFTTRYDDQETLKWYKKSADQGHHRAQFRYGQRLLGSRDLTDQQIAEAIAYLTKAAEAGDVRALSDLGEYYEEGRYVSQNHNKAMEYFLKAAEGGNAYCYGWAGQIYFNGDGVPQDKAKGIEWWKKGWEDYKDGFCAYALGYSYENGDGVPANRQEAIKWYRLGASKYESDCIDSLNRLGVK